MNGQIPITQVTGETADISEYLDFAFYDRVWWKDNAGLSPAEPGRWLGVSYRVGRAMCYFILTQRGTVVSRHTVQRVTSLEMGTPSVKEMFEKFDKGIETKLKLPRRGYEVKIKNALITSVIKLNITSATLDFIVAFE